MTRRRGQSEESDSLDLLLDTVSNVFGGVMFLTLLAALLILSRGATRVEEQTTVDPEVIPTNTTLIEAETRRTAAALEAQRTTRDRLDPDGTLADKAKRLQEIEATLALANRHNRRASDAEQSQEQAQQDLQAQQSDLEKQIEELRNEVAQKSKANEEIRSSSERAVEFRGLSLSMTREAVVMLRYGRWYLLQTARSPKSLNREDLFILENSRSLTRITPKPHRGNPVTDESVEKLVGHLKRVFSPKSYHVVIAVWDDSFAEFNQLKDGIKEAGFQYRTLPCDTSTRLTNNAAVDAYVQ